jgi:3-methyladenine DNA glycosylase AlkD
MIAEEGMSTRAKEIVAAVRDKLEKNADEKTRESAHRFFKEEVRFHGVKTAAVVKIAKQYFK